MVSNVFVGSSFGNPGCQKTFQSRLEAEFKFEIVF